jgi:hypothetical protein
VRSHGRRDRGKRDNASQHAFTENGMRSHFTSLQFAGLDRDRRVTASADCKCCAV